MFPFPRGWRDPTLAARIARAETFTGFADSPPEFLRRGATRPTSVAQVAFSTAVKLTGGPWDPIDQAADALEAMRRVQSEQASGRVRVLRNVPYVHRAATYKQSSDIYYPEEGERSGLPMIVHFHGGGWSHGDKAHELFGAPAFARSHAAAGFVVITPSYRLGDSSAFMADAQQAVLWAVANAVALGADPTRLYLSGHSAGGNIAASLAVGPWLAPPVLPTGAIKGVIGISGVYSLMRPLGGFASCYKNHIFHTHMRKRVFGDELPTLIKHSPAALLRLANGETAPFKPRWVDVIGTIFRDALSAVHISSPTAEAEAANPAGRADALPPLLLLNASWDLGLEDDAANFANVVEARTGVKPMHHIVPNTSHATVCWDEAAFCKCRDFIAACEAGRGRGEAALI